MINTQIHTKYSPMVTRVLKYQSPALTTLWWVQCKHR